MKRRVWLAATAALGLALSPERGADANSGSGRADPVAELESLREAILETRDRLSGHERKERELLGELEALDRRALRAAREVDVANAAAQSARTELARVEARELRIEKQLAGTRRAMAARMVALYKAGELGPLRVLFSSTSLHELLGRFSALRSLVRYDVDLMARFERETRALAQARSDAGEASATRDAALARREERSQALEEERAAKRALLASVRRDRGEERGLLVELEQAARALEETLDALGDASQTGGGFAGTGFGARRGSLSPPVDAAVSAPFGRVVDAEFRTETLRTGLEFAAPHGETVRAVADGQIRFADWFRGYGKLVIVDHGDDYFSVSGHLAEILVGVGDRVSEGQPIGSVGETGSLNGPSLYFEIRRGAEPLDPATWLALRVRG